MDAELFEEWRRGTTEVLVALGFHEYVRRPWFAPAQTGWYRRKMKAGNIYAFVETPGRVARGYLPWRSMSCTIETLAHGHRWVQKLALGEVSTDFEVSFAVNKVRRALEDGVHYVLKGRAVSDEP